MKLILIIVSVIISEARAPADNNSNHDSPTHELYRSLPEQQRLMFIDYLTDKIKSTNKPNFVTPSESNTPSKSSSSINSIKRYEECRRTRRYKPSTTNTSNNTNASTRATDHTDENIFDYRAGKVARISNNGTVKIDGKIVYDKDETLRPAPGYKFKVENGTLTANGKTIFKNIPASKYKTGTRTCDFQSESDEISLKVLETGEVKCTDSNHNRTLF